jgi:Trypsin-like peptidase domain
VAETLWSFSESAFVDVDLPVGHPMYGAIMPIVVRRGTAWEVAGTAFVVGPHAALTAAHTVTAGGQSRVDEASLLFRGNRNEDGTVMGGLLPITSINVNSATDLALLTLLIPEINGESLRLTGLKLSFVEVSVGERCAVVGYTSGLRFDISDPPVMELSPVLHASAGEVRHVHQRGRDASFLRFPSFQLSAHAPHQMSGSPILGGPGQTKAVVGVLSSGFDLGDGGEPISYGSALWPAAGLRMTLRVDEDALQAAGVLTELIDGAGEFSLHDLARLGYVGADSSTEDVIVDKSSPDDWRVRLLPK